MQINTTTGLKVKINEALNFTERELAKLHEACTLLEKVWNSTEFRERILNFKYEQWVKVGKWPRRKWKKEVINSFNWSEGYTNKEIYADLMSGRDDYDTRYDSELDLYIEIDRDNVDGVLGYTMPDSKFIWIYEWFFKEASPAEVAGNLAHELTHCMGYGHSYEWNETREYTVPYAVGYIVEELAAKLI